MPYAHRDLDSRMRIHKQKKKKKNTIVKINGKNPKGREDVG